MNCDIQRVVKNSRYRILTINGEKFILDIWGSFWKIVFPFFFWMLPNSVYKVDDPDLVEKLTTLEVKQNKIRMALAVLAGGVSVFLGNLLTPLMDYFNFQSTKLVRLMIITITIIVVLTLFFYMAKRCKIRLYSMANLERLPTDRLWIRPMSFKHFFQVLFSYLIFLLFALFAFAAFFNMPNVIALLVAAAFSFLLLIVNAMTVMGESTTVKFRE
ncbi:DUF443 family protein [Lentibacillus sp. Marseille-P4043]|uniref:DUF443 family protein n=1 Tax=Lentibacillus sp. Marseille-P4043 TaxID=2040293 RepID=UPI00131A545A|nr:DUF443 family protein [Lentibacillus sp. Marseille-P4043]